MSFDPTKTYRSVTDIDGNIFAYQAGWYYDRYGNRFLTLPVNKEGYAPPTDVEITPEFLGDTLVINADATGTGNDWKYTIARPTSTMTSAQTLTLPATGGTAARTQDKLSAFAATTSAELAGVISDEEGTSGGFVRATGAALAPVSINGVTTDSTTNKPVTAASLAGSTLPASVTTLAATADALTLNSDAAGSGADWTLNLERPAAGMTGAATITLPTVTGNLARTQDKLSVFAATTSAELAGVITNETGSDALVFANTPTLVAPLLGTPTSGILTNCTTATAADNDADTSLASTAFVKGQIATDKNSTGLAQSINLTGDAATGTPISALDNANLDVGTANFSIKWKGSLPDWTAFVNLVIKYAANFGFRFRVFNSRFELVLLRNDAGITFTSTITYSLPAGSTHEITISVIRETAGTAGSVTFYLDGVLFGAAVTITAAATETLDNTANLNILGVSATGTRYAGLVQSTHTFNRALSAADALDIYRNGIVFADKWGNQTGQTSGTLVLGKRYRITAFVAGDDFTNIGASSNATGVEFITTGTTPTTWTNSSTLNEIGALIALEPESIQPAPGQWHDVSTNKNHAMQPPTGSSILRRKKEFEIRWTNSWSNTNEAQYICGVNQAVLPTNFYLTSIIGVITGADVQDIVIGDGSTADKFVTITTGLAAGTVAFTIASAIGDGTNFKLVVDPDTNATMTIVFTVRGIILE